MKLIKGFREYLEKSEDKNLKACKEKYGIFFIFKSIEAWKKEGCNEKDLPKKDIVREEFKRNRFIAHP